MKEASILQGTGIDWLAKWFWANGASLGFGLELVTASRGVSTYVRACVRACVCLYVYGIHSAESSVTFCL